MAEPDKFIIVISTNGRERYAADACVIGQNNNILTITKDEVTQAEFQIWHSWHWETEDELASLSLGPKAKKENSGFWSRIFNRPLKF